MNARGAWKLVIPVAAIMASLMPLGAADGAGVKSAVIVTFRTPSGLTICGSTRFTDERPILRCNVTGGLTPLPPRPNSCKLEWGVGLEMSSSTRPDIVCASDSGFNPNGAPVLGYGRTWRHFTFACTAQPQGLTCRNPQGHGWFLSRKHWRTFDGQDLECASMRQRPSDPRP